MTNQKKLLSQRHPIFYFVSVWEKRIRKYISWFFDGKKYTKIKNDKRLSFRVKKHQSRLLRKLGDTEMWLQHNKIKNLEIAIQQINGVLIRPNETFSFCKTVGLPTKRKGYVLGMEISGGKARPGIGGGICQCANMLHWLALHSPLNINERHHHSIDPFPDDGRVLPWASGAAVFYNYLDFQLTNNTDKVFQIKLWLTDECLKGELLVNEELDYSYRVFEKNHKFLKKGNQYFRTNEIWQRTINKKTGNTELNTLIAKNYGKVMYIPKTYEKEGKTAE